MKLSCMIGRHKWEEDYSSHNPKRKCICCGMRQAASYDMLYGETIWINMGFGSQKTSEENKDGK